MLTFEINPIHHVISAGILSDGELLGFHEEERSAREGTPKRLERDRPARSGQPQHSFSPTANKWAGFDPLKGVAL